MTPPGWRPICARPMPCAVPAGSSRWNSGGRKWPTIRSWAANIWPPPCARAQLALDRFDTDKSIGRLLEESGYGNHPAVLRFFSRLADSLLEDSLPGSEGGGSLPPLEERMYAGWSSQRS